MTKKLASIGLYLFAVIVIMLLYYFFIFKPSQQILQSKIENKFKSNMIIQSMLLDNSVSRAIEGCKSMSSRTMIKNKIVEYKNGVIDLQELKQYTKQKYIDGLKALENCVYALRIMGKDTICDVQFMKIINSAEILSDTSKNSLFASFHISDTTACIYVISPIQNKNNETIAYDILFFLNNFNLIKELNQQINFEIFTNKQNEYKSAVGNQLYHLNSDTLYIEKKVIKVQIKSSYADAFYVFSIPEKDLLEELKNFYKSQYIVLFLIALLILLTQVVFQKRQKWIFF